MWSILARWPNHLPHLLPMNIDQGSNFKILYFIRCRPCSFRVINENNAHFKLFLKNLFYNFRSKKKIKYRSNENCHKWKMLYSYPVPFCERYYSTKKKYVITTSRIMILQERHWTNFYITVALYVHYFRPFDVLKKLSFHCFMETIICLDNFFCYFPWFKMTKKDVSDVALKWLYFIIYCNFSVFEETL